MNEYIEELKKLEEKTKKERDRLKRLDINQLMEEIEEFLKHTKDIHKTVYKLAFIYTSNDNASLTALLYLHELKERGVVSDEFVNKAIEDVKRWRKLVLDREYIDERIRNALKEFQKELEKASEKQGEYD